MTPRNTIEESSEDARPTRYNKRQGLCGQRHSSNCFRLMIIKNASLASRYAFFEVACLLFALSLSQSAAAQWIRISPPTIGRYTGSIFTFGTRIFVSTDSDVFVTTDEGSHWKDENLHDTVGPDGYFASIGNIIFYGSINGVCNSTDSGITWKKEAGSPGAVLGLASIEGRLFAASDWDDLEFSDDLGRTWHVPFFGFNLSSHFHNVTVLGNLIFAQSEGDVRFNTTGGVIRSSDDGNTWQHVALVNNVVAYGGIGTHYYFTGGDSGFYASSDYGQTWTGRTGVLPDSGAFGCFLSYSSFIIGGSSIGLFISTDSGNTWFQKDSELLPDSAVVALAQQNGYLIAGSWDSGVWRIPLSEIIGSNADAASYPGIKSLSVYPNPTLGPINIRGAVGSIVVTDVLGQVVFTASTQPQGSLTLNLTNEPAGIYFVRTGEKSSKVIVSH